MWQIKSTSAKISKKTDESWKEFYFRQKNHGKLNNMWGPQLWYRIHEMSLEKEVASEEKLSTVQYWYDMHKMISEKIKHSQ